MFDLKMDHEELLKLVTQQLEAHRLAKKNNTETSPLFITVNEVALLLRVPRGTVYYWASRGMCPHMKIGRHLRFPLPGLLKWLEEQPAHNKRRCDYVASELEKRKRSLKTKNAGRADLLKKGETHGNS